MSVTERGEIISRTAYEAWNELLDLLKQEHPNRSDKLEGALWYMALSLDTALNAL